MLSAAEEAQLTKMLSKYQRVTHTKKDIIDVMSNYRSLTYRLEKFVFNHSVAKDLINLQGTIPVTYKDNRYNIPICIWLMDTHPANAPICFVKPTSYMEIKVSMYVDHTGKIYLPYLHDWKPNSSDLLSLIQVMIVTFGDQPPVFSKRKEQMAPYPPAVPSSGGSMAGSDLRPYPSGSPMPPYPTGGFPPYMPFHGGQMPGPNPNPTPPLYMNYPPGTGYNSGYNSSNASSTGTITEEHIKASLISAVEDKLRRRVQEKVNQYQAEIETLNRTKQELMEGSVKIDAIILRLQREEVELQKNITILKDKEQELQKSLDQLENADGIDPDEAVTTTAPLYKQLLNAYAEEAAIEDAIYYLGEALRSNVIDLETFLKHVRQLSRKQFMQRAIMQKCRQKAGLAG